MTVFLCFGSPDECVNCGGSATLGGTQEALVTDHGTFCSTDCHDEAAEFADRAKRAVENSRVYACRDCGLDNYEHTADCPKAANHAR